MVRWFEPWTVGCLALILAGCARHTVDVQPIRVEPIHMTIDINVRVDRELDEFFDFRQEQVIVVPPATQPSTQPHAPAGGMP